MPRSLPLPDSLLRLAEAQGGLVSAAQCDVAGVAQARRGRLVRSGRWGRTTTGVYVVDPHAPVGAELRRRRAAWTGVLAYGPGAAAVGTSALVLHGVAGLPTTITPEVVLRGLRHTAGRDGIRVRRFSTVVRPYGAAFVAPLPEALVQALPELPRDNAVAVLDDVLHRRLVPDAEMARVRAATGGRRGAAGLHACWGLADRRAESPLETFARLQCVDAGIAPDELQPVVRAPDGRQVARCDLAWRRADSTWLLVEVDGREFHDVPAAVMHDRHRQNALAVLGHTVLRVTSTDVSRRAVAPLVRAALLPRPR